MKTLVAYFSNVGETEIDRKVVELEKGHTEIVAEKIAKVANADLYKIEPVKPYPTKYDDIVNRARDEHNDNATVEIKHPLESLDEYDTIYLGFPIWYRTYPRIVATFIKSYDLSGKKIKPFCTNEEGFFGTALLELESTLPNSEITAGLSITGGMVNDSDARIEKFVNEK